MKILSMLLILTGALHGASLPDLGLTYKKAEGGARAYRAEYVRDFTLPRLGGGTVRLSDYRGKVVLVDFWAAWCGPCRMTMPAVHQLYLEYKNKGLVVIGVNVDTDARLRDNFLRELQERLGAPIGYPIALDSDSAVFRANRFRGLPSFMIIDRQGQLHQRFTGAAPKEDLKEAVDAALGAAPPEASGPVGI